MKAQKSLTATIVALSALSAACNNAEPDAHLLSELRTEIAECKAQLTETVPKYSSFFNSEIPTSWSVWNAGEFYPITFEDYQNNGIDSYYMLKISNRSIDPSGYGFHIVFVRTASDMEQILAAEEQILAPDDLGKYTEYENMRVFQKDDPTFPGGTTYYFIVPDPAANWSVGGMIIYQRPIEMHADVLHEFRRFVTGLSQKPFR